MTVTLAGANIISILPLSPEIWAKFPCENMKDRIMKGAIEVDTCFYVFSED
jgi:hypothetical protein